MLLQDMILRCVNNNEECNKTVTIQKTLTQDYGMCYHFQQDSKVKSSGSRYGLQVLFNLEAYDSIGLFTPNDGLKVFFTAHGEPDRYGDVVVDWTSEISLSPGFDHSIKLKPQKIVKKGKPYSDCEDYGTGALRGFNTRDDCQQSCFLR